MAASLTATALFATGLLALTAPSAAGLAAEVAGTGRDIATETAEQTELRARAYVLYIEAYEATASGQLEKARALLEEVLEHDPNAARVHSMLARVCLRRSDLLCAETEAGRAVELADADADGHKVLAELALNRYRRSADPLQLEAALQHLQSAVAAEPQDVSLWTLLIRLIGSEGRFEEAEREARRAASTPGIDPAKPWLALARTYLSRGETERAVRLLEELNLTSRSAVPLLRMLADLKGNRKDIEGQVQVLRRLLALRPEDPEVAHRLGGGLLSLGDPYAALEPLHSALTSRPNNPLVRRDLARAFVALGQGEQAIEQLRHLPSVYLTPHTSLLWAQAAEQADRFDLAAEKIELMMTELDGTEHSSLVPRLKLRAARNWLRAGQPDRALLILDRLEPDVRVVRIRFAALKASGRIDEAASLLAQALRNNPREPGFVAHKAESLQVAGRPDEALETLLKKYASATDRTAMLSGMSRWLLGWEQAALAARLLDAIGLSDEPDPKLLRIRAVTLNEAGRIGEAEAAYRRLLELSPDDDSILNELGYLLASGGRSLPEAVELLERAVALKPQESSYLDSLGWAHHLAGRSERALPLLQQAVRTAQDSEIGVIREHLGDVYEALGDSSRALAEWHAALIFGGEDEQRLMRKIESQRSTADRP